MGSRTSLSIAAALAAVTLLLGSAARAEGSTLHLTLTYEPAVLATKGWFGNIPPNSAETFGVTMHNVGVDLSVGGGQFRYHFRLSYTDFVQTAGESAEGLSETVSISANGTRIDPLEFGWAIPVLRSGGWGVEVEPMISLLETFFVSAPSEESGGGTTGTTSTLLLLGAGFGVGVNVDFGMFHAVLKPINFDIVYFEDDLNPPAGATSTSLSGANLMYRFGIGLGINL
jgi:hypothetical protein